MGAGTPVVTAPPAPPAPVKKPDPRYLALRNFAISMSVFNIFGYTLLGFEQPWSWPFWSLLLAYSAEYLIEVISARVAGRKVSFAGRGFRGHFEFLLPAHITALAANMLLYANDRFAPIAFAVLVGIGGKVLFRAPLNGRMRHFMNPSNLGITAALLCFPWVNVAPPYHFTENVPDMISILIPVIIITSGTVLNAMLTKRIPLILGWLGGFIIQAVVRHEIWDVAVWAALLPMTGVAFVLFTNYMVTDPGTTPTGGRNQFMFGAGVATVYAVLMTFNIVYTMFFAVTIVCLIRGVSLWYLWLRDRRVTAPA
ncbi:enediyne biosynthesis protein [Paractinoplanes ovalisporus]|uniref:enediyne biosynthesis protein n=1 Tax=Paractinoplanes ovalisporus TaxID=2810368 RepID=UPI0027DC0BF6|nr:enediyne biosynthesis protein [Actinoplanes ovalisporus]